jgi:hypothetical protein
MSESLRPIVVGGVQLAECVRESSDSSEWSIPSATSFPRREEFFRCVLVADCDGVTLEDRRVTSSRPNALPLESVKSSAVHLTLDEAEWLLARLPDAIEAAKRMRV